MLAEIKNSYSSAIVTRGAVFAGKVVKLSQNCVPSYYRARYYDPASGRFLGEDEARFNGAGINFYNYAINRPTILRDPDGRNPACIVGGLLGTIVYNSYVIYDSLHGHADCYAGFTGLMRTLKGNAAAFGAGCAVGSAFGAATDAFAPLTPQPGEPLPPGWNDAWEYRFSEGDSPSSPRWFDENGGEWRYHDVDPWHSTPHWDYNPWSEWNSPWQNIPKP